MDIATPTYTRLVPDRSDAVNEGFPRHGDAVSKDRVETPSGERFTLHINHVFDVSKGAVLFPLHYIADEPFTMDVQGGLIILQHEEWSLQGTGLSLLDAERNLVQNARGQFDALKPTTAEELAFRNFILKVL